MAGNDPQGGKDEGHKDVRDHRADRRHDNDPRDMTETDLAGRKMGENSLQGDDQHNVHNQRHAVPDEKTETDDIIEGLEKMDKDERARRESGKKNSRQE